MISNHSTTCSLLKKLVIVCIIITVSFSGLLGVIALGIFDWNIQQVIVGHQTETHLEYAEKKDMTRYFSKDYSTARKRFIDAGVSAGAIMSRLVLEERGPAGEVLTIDIAWLGRANPKRALLHTSGLHGVEGFAGSAIQLKILESKPVPPKGNAIVFVHALNPYGMAWLRRYNESNVDLNRNFRFDQNDWSEESPVYVKLDRFLNPTNYRLFDSFLLQACFQIRRYGMDVLRQTIPVGQNFNPKGLFYYGGHLEQGPRLYCQWLRNSLSFTERLIVIDVHTGLGKLGEESLFHKIIATDSPSLFEEIDRQNLTGFVPKSGTGYTHKGGHSEAFKQFADHCHIDFITQEFGTYPNVYVLQALRDENRSHHFDRKSLKDQTKHRLQEAFNPKLSAWQSKVIRSGESLFLRSVELIFNHENG